MKAFPRLLVASLFLFSHASAGEAEQTLLEAAAKGDAPRIVLALSEAAADTRDKDGRTALMLAAKAGDFESVRRLLWSGADPTLKDNTGKTARDFLDPAGEAYAPLSLVIRCYAFTKEYARPPQKVRTPHLALVNDSWVDPSHPDLAKTYSVNKTELNGKRGVDDDKNGFTDDVYGWNFASNEPLRAPQLSLDHSPETTEWLAKLINDFLAADAGDTKLRDLLEGRYDNPLVKQIGFSNLAGADIDLNDYAYANMLYAASHGTHVAGIISRFSGGKALLHGTAIGMTSKPSARMFDNLPAVVELAKNSPNYPAFISAVLDRYLGEAVAKGRRASDYVRTCGAGVVNMSWGRPRPYFERLAAELASIYKQNGQDPASIDAAPPADMATIMANLPLELCMADAATFALAFRENPDVFVVIAAGNEATDNDTLLPSPQYLSRFFPNVITVASVDAAGNPSKFTNRGTRSVQIAAPGEDIDSTILAGLHAPMSGTSMAAPVVAGAAAGIRADFPTLSATDVRRVLEASARHTPALATVCSTSGILDAEAARLMAASWSGNNLAMLVDETRKAKVAGPDGPKLKSTRLIDALKLKPPVKRNGPALRITAVAGFDTTWRVAMSAGSGYGTQLTLGPGPWPAEAVNKAWDDGYRITSLAGDQEMWNVIFSKGVKGNQSVFGYEIDQTQITAAMKEGFRITHVAGWKDRWLVVLNTDTGYGEQRYTLPTPLNDSRLAWLKKRWDEGFRITSIGGDDTPEDEQDGWLIVMTKNSGLTDQNVSLPGPWPAEWIQQHQAQGYRVTAMAGSGNHVVVVVSKGTKLSAQEISGEGESPESWIKERW